RDFHVTGVQTCALPILGVSVSLLINGNMHQRAQAISSSNAVIGQIYAWRNEVNEFTDLRAVNRQLAMALAAERNRRHTLPQQDTVQTIADRARRYSFITAQV